MTPEAQAALNFARWWSYHGVIVEPLHTTSSRAWYRRSLYLDAVIAALAGRKILLPAEAGNHGVDVEHGYREDVAGVSAQLVVHSWFLEMDFDFHDPTRDLVSAVGHVGELFVNKITGHTTDPFAVAVELRKRGLDL